MRQSYKDAYKLLKAKTYILITPKETFMAGDLRKLPDIMRLHTLVQLQAQIEKLVRKYEKKVFKGKK
jgi:hypothetical protein